MAHEARLAGPPLLVLPGGPFKNHFAQAAALGSIETALDATGRRPKTRGAVALALGGRTDALAARLPFLLGPAVMVAFTADELSVRVRDADPGDVLDGEAALDTPGEGLDLTILPAALAVCSSRLP